MESIKIGNKKNDRINFKTQDGKVVHVPYTDLLNSDGTTLRLALAFLVQDL
jgi:hypothetical protein